MALVCAHVAHAQGYPPDEAPSRMTLQPGLKAQLVASEPVIRQPVAVEFDDRGRMWVVQYLQYPNPEGLSRVKVDRYSRTEYDRVPEPPPHGPKGSDVITILEDTDGDGRMDTSKNFLEGLNLCTGIAFGHGGVYVIQVPYLLFYPDRNRDDIPDSDPEVLVTGFGMEDAHSVANSLTWGPDGWLYGLQGSTVTANINGIEFQQGIWRYHPLTKTFELFCEGGGNMWGLDFDKDGNLFACTNFGPYIVLHGLQGAYYWKQFGKHGALHNPYTFGYFDHVAHHNAEGGHVVVGGTIYEADALPAEYHGKFIAPNLLSHNVYWHELKRTGSTFESIMLGELMNSNDTWFAPSDMALGPDGLLYIADWCDSRKAHPDPDATWDRSNGRVYRIAPENVRPAVTFDLASATSNELLDMLDHPNKWFVRRALVILAERRDESLTAALRNELSAKNKPELALNTLFALNASGGFDDRIAAKLLRHPNGAVRKWTVRLLGDKQSVSPRVQRLLVDLASNETDVMVRSQLASTAKRLPTEYAVPIAWHMAQHDADAKDPHLPLLIWWAFEHHAKSGAAAIGSMIEDTDNPNALVMRETILPRLARRYAADGTAEADAACVQLFASASKWNAETSMLEGIEAGLQDRQRPAQGGAAGSLFAGYSQQSDSANGDASAAPPVSNELREALVSRWHAQPDTPLLLRLATRLGNAEAYERVKSIAANASTDEETRLTMLAILSQFGKADSLPILLATVGNGQQSPAVRKAGLDAIRRIPEASVADALVSLYPNLDASMKSNVRDALFTRASWSTAFVKAVDAGAIPVADVPLDQIRAMAAHDDESLRALIEKHWGSVRPGTPEEKLADMRRLNNELNAGKGDPAKGKLVYKKNCAQCHQFFGEGFNVGPELTQSNRMDREYMLASMVDPNLTVRKEYLQYVVETSDGGLYNGLIAERTPGSVTLINANNVRTTIPMKDVTDLREAGLSLMPEGIITALPGDDIRDLFAYLQSQEPATVK